MGMFRKKPVVIEARCFTDVRSGCDILDWSDFKIALCSHTQDEGERIPYLEIDTLEGKMIAAVGDWVICCVKGEFYPCKPDIFAATYDPVD